MSQPPGLKAAFKRGALIAAANWPLVLVQFVAEATLKLLLAVPVIGGLVLVVLLLDADAGDLLAGDIREIVAGVFNVLRSSPAALAAVILAFVLELLGGSALTFVVKGGTVALLADADASAGPIERGPLRLAALRRANVTDIDPFLDGCRRLWVRYVKLGACLLAAYALTAGGYIAFVVGGYRLAENVGALIGWTILAFGVSSALIVWITLLNLGYLLTQMIMAVRDVGVRAAVVEAGRFVRTRLRDVAGIFGVVLLLAVLATIVTAGLGLMTFVPLVGLALLPLQIAAWLLRGIVFQYLALAALGAYLTHYRDYLHGAPLAAVPGKRSA